MTTTTIPAERESAVVAAVPSGLWIGGGDRPATGGATLDVHDPSTGEVLAEVADATADDARAALDAAVAAQRSWARRGAARTRRDPARGPSS